MKKIVTIGGGTGQYALLRGLKHREAELTAIVSMFDNGGSTGRLRTDFGVSAPGDLRNCLLALSNRPGLESLVRVFEHRYRGTEGPLANHNVGNVLLLAFQQVYGPIEGIQQISKLLEVEGKVLPVSPDPTHIFGTTTTGRELKGEVEVSYPKKDERIAKVWLDPEAHIYKEAAQELRQADAVVICPGDLYGSIIPNFLVRGFNEALQQSRAKMIYVCNLVTKQGTADFKASDFVREIERHCERRMDRIIMNTIEPSKRVVDKYRQEDSYFVQPDINDERAVKADLLVEHESGDTTIVRHNPETVSRLIMSLV